MMKQRMHVIFSSLTNVSQMETDIQFYILVDESHFWGYGVHYHSEELYTTVTEVIHWGICALQHFLQTMRHFCKEKTVGSIQWPNRRVCSDIQLRAGCLIWLYTHLHRTCLWLQLEVCIRLICSQLLVVVSWFLWLLTSDAGASLCRLTDSPVVSCATCSWLHSKQYFSQYWKLKLFDCVLFT